MIEGQTVRVGRSSDDLPLTDYTVSRRHAEISPQGRGWYLTDLKSSNGTYVNGSRLERPVRLKHGDQIRLGSTLMVWDGSMDRPLEGQAETTTIATNLVDLEVGDRRSDAAIIGSVVAGDDSMILASPAAAEAVRTWRVVSALLEAVGTVESPHQLVERVIDLVFEKVPVDRGFILMKEEHGGKFETEVVRCPPDCKDKIRASRTIVDHVITNREGILCSNAMSDARFRGGEGGSVAAMGLQSVICVPMIARDQVLGVIYMDCAMAKHVYTEEQLRLVASIGQMAALAIEDARLVKERMRTERLAATGETVAAVSHYIKNILQGMKGGSDVVALGLRNSDLSVVQQGWQIVDRNLDKIYSLAMDMLAFAKRREPKLDPIQLKSLMADVLKLVQRRADEKGVLLKSELSDLMPPILIDEHGIRQAVMNIIVNAIDAVPQATGVVRVQATYDPKGQAAAITVEDNGPGIPEEIREKVFDAFYSTKGQGGTGLGLAVAKKIVDEHGGVIELKSKAGQGTLIRVVLPATPKGPAEGGAHVPVAPDDTHGPGAHGAGGS
jgi:signal transduction histidine kinase